MKIQKGHFKGLVSETLCFKDRTTDRVIKAYILGHIINFINQIYPKYNVHVSSENTVFPRIVSFLE